ncbi:response regulator [Chamaesiphon sp. GL140_3_metabinner_50]|uniref:hybrid sensor histidine kinase/response regulator n=1 Tax=Chamaesiphon sp. GL140_3_metabinner_50 TaxID=2970812 RepID=UPI0025DD4AFA|nr:response regulator [Chamaesiphon sp. GL140_3_metabinner_50]
MITSDREQQIKLQFLDEAIDYLETIESGLLGLGAGKVDAKQLDALMRAAHSIKGGAGMMGFTTLAGLGHHLEDYFKIIQYGKSAAPDDEVERLLLGTIDKLGQIVALNRQGQDADKLWLEKQVQPLFDRLRELLGEFNPEDEANMLASESGEDILTFLFESEVERSLTQLEISVNSDNSGSLYDELLVSAEELGGLSEMVELPALRQLCESVLAHIKGQPHRVRAIAALALAAWRRTQALVLIGQTSNLPCEIELPGSGIVSISEAATIPEWHDDTDVSTYLGDGITTLDKSQQVPQSARIIQSSITHDSLDLQDFTLDTPLTIDDLGGRDDTKSEYAGRFGTGTSAHDFPTLTDPFAADSTTAPPFSTITDSSELDAFATSEQYSDGFHLRSTVVPDADEEIVDAFEMLDLSGDLSLDTDASGLLSDLSGFLGEDLPSEISSAVFKINPKGASKATSKAAITSDLDREAADLLSALDAAPEVIDDTPADREQVAAKSKAPAQAEQTIRVATKQLAEIGDLFGELTIDRNGLNLNLQGLRQLVANLQNKVKQLEQSNFKLREAYDLTSTPERLPNSDETWTQSGTSLTSNLTDELDLLEFDRYSELHFLSQEVMDNIVQIEELTTDLDTQLNDTERTNRDLNRTAKQLQTGLTQVRMRPISELFDRFPRAIRNLSIEHSKPIDLQLKGGTTLIERSILEALNDPLMHLLRNAFDHGIEPSAVRRASDKSDTGKIEISATYRGNQTVITIKDDGGGIDLDKIRAKVKKMGIDDKEIANFKDNELIDLIFEPGFSTADKLTDLSGRGVGMDVVRTNIRALRGDIFVDTKLGKGSTFTITVPFTLSVVRVLIVEVNGLWLAIPSNIVEEIILLNPDRIISTAGQKMLQWEDFTVRLIQPGDYLRIPDFTPPLATTNTPTIDCPTVLMIDQGQDVVAVAIDKFWGEQEVTIRQPQGNIKMPPGFTGCTILGDGRIVPLLDAIEFVRWIDGDFGANSLRTNTLNFNTEDTHNTSAPAATVQRDRILVVDDSINVRRFVALTLEKAGYLVEQAKDGQEAVEKLQTGIQVQAVVCDVEMPRMDGYGFLATVKGAAQFKNIPVLMLTSRSGDKHRKIAMNLGASAYFAKPFKEQELLASLSQLIVK